MVALALAAPIAAVEDAAVQDAPRPAPAPVVLPDELPLLPASEWTEVVSRRRQLVATAPQAVTVLGKEDLVTSPAVSLPDRLRFEPGIDVYQSRHGQFDVGMRGYNGLNNSRIIVQYDGRSLNWPTFGSILWRGQFNLSDVSRLEIAKGPSSVAYGANAFGGVISIDARTPDDQHRFYTHGALGTSDLREVDGTALGPLGNGFYYKVGVGLTYLGDLPGNVGHRTYIAHPRTRDTGDDDLRSRRYNASLGYEVVENLRLEAEYSAVDMPEWEFVDDLDVGSNWTSWDMDNFGLRARTPWGELRWLRSYADFDYSNQKAFYGAGLNDFNYAQAGVDEVTDTIRGQGNHRIGDHDVSLGAEYWHLTSESNLWSNQGVFADEDSWASVTSTNRALFAQDQWAFAPSWIGTAGARVDDHSLVGANVSPRVAFNFIPDQEQFYLLSLSSGYRLPTMIESYIQQYYFASDPELDAERIVAAELGWQRRDAIDGWKIGANGYYNQSNDQIWTLPLDEAQMRANQEAWITRWSPAERPFHQPGPYFQFQNLDNPVDVWGLELSGELPIFETGLKLWANGTFQRYRHREDVIYQSDGTLANPFAPAGPTNPVIFAFDANLGREINAPPRWKGTLGLSYERGVLFTGIDGRYVHHRRIFSFAHSGFQSRGLVEVQDVPAYVTCDLYLGLDFSSDHDRSRYVRMTMLDLFDSDHYEWYEASSTQLAGTPGANAREQQLTSSLGRQFAIEVGWAF